MSESELKPERRLDGFLILICLVFAAIFGVWFVESIRLYQKARQSLDWLRTTATVTEWELCSRTDSRGQAKVYSFHCRYTFRVNGTDYVGERIKISPFENKVNHPSERSTRLSERYQVGATCDVWYNPDDPSDAVLEPGTDTWEPLEFWYLRAWIPCAGLLVVSAWGLGRKRGWKTLEA